MAGTRVSPSKREVVLEPREIRTGNDNSERRRLRSRSRGDLAPNRSEIGVCTKYTLFAENFLIFVIGGAMASLGAYILYLKEKKVNDVLDFFFDPSCDMCLIGSIMLLMGFLGWWGSLRENTIFLKAYYYLMLIFLLMELTVCVLTFVAYYAPEVKEKIFPTDTFQTAIEKYRDDIDMQNLIDSMQESLGCCGLSDSEEGFLDWNQNPYFKCAASNPSPERCSVPYTCCRHPSGKIINHQCGWKVFEIGKDGEPVVKTYNYTANIYTDGCLKALGTWVDDNALVVGGVLLGILLPQLVVIVMTTNLIKMIQRQKLRWCQ